MELDAYVENRRRRYLAQALSSCEEAVDPLVKRLPLSAHDRAEVERALEDLRRDVRRSFRNFSNDIADAVTGIDSPHINGVAVGIRDRVR